MGSSKRKLDKSDSRHKKKSKKRPESDVEDAGIKYLGHAGKEVKVCWVRTLHLGTSM